MKSVLAPNIGPLTPEQPIEDALQQRADCSVPWLPVVANQEVIGGLGVRDAVAADKNTLPRSARRTRALPDDTSGFEVQLRADSPAIGRALSDAGPPRHVLLASIRRDGETVFPSAATKAGGG